MFNEGLKKIGKNAFAGCCCVDSIMLPTTLIELGYRAFFNALSLKEVIFNGVLPKIVGKSAFAYSWSTSLERFVFPGIATRLEAIIDAGQVEVADKVNRISRIEWRDGGVSVSVTSLQKDWDDSTDEVTGGVENWTAIWNSINELDDLITHYELKEATILLELALWKHRMNHHQKTMERDNSSEKGVGESDVREHCRVSCGSNIVIEHVLPYLLPDPGRYSLGGP